MRIKKWLSMFLVVAMTVSMLPQTGSEVWASEAGNAKEAIESVEEDVSESAEDVEMDVVAPEEEEKGEYLTEETEDDEETISKNVVEEPEADSVSEDAEKAGVSEQEEEEKENTSNDKETEQENISITEPVDAEEEKNKNSATEGDETEAVSDTIFDANDTDNENVTDEIIEEVDSEDMPTLMSLLPLKEVRATLVLNGYSKEQLKKLPLKTVLGLIKDEDGNPIEIADNLNLVWNYYKDEWGDHVDDEYHVIDRNATVDLSASYDSETSYEMELIVGNGKQLDADSIRYIINVYVNAIREDINYYVYTEDESGNRSRVFKDRVTTTESAVLDGIGIPVAEVSYYTSSSAYKEGTKCYLGITSSVSKDTNHSNIKVDIYPMKNFLAYHQKKASLNGAITDQILNQEDLNSSGGYESVFGALNTANPAESDNMFCIVYTDVDTGVVLSYQGLIFYMRSQNLGEVKGNMYTYENGVMKSISNARTLYTGGSGWSIDSETEPSQGMIDYYIGGTYFQLFSGYDEHEEYYFALEKNDQIAQVVVGYFNNRAEAEKAKAEDITAQILPADRNKAPFGYKANYYDDFCFTIFFKNGTALKYYVYAESESDWYDYDLDFSMTGAVGYDDIYKVYTDRLDTYYGNGYQTLFINDTDADLAKLIPEFRCGENVKVYVGTEQKSGESVQDFSKGTVEYTAVGNGNKNYFVTFVKKESGAKLFVNGPDKREVFLTNRYDNRHNILIANVGDAELTGLKAELINPVHVKLDDYWTIGGAGNDTLAAFTTTYSRDPEGNDVDKGELGNLAKICLLPDGDGVISGTLKISADGQEPVYIELTGYAGNPEIVTDDLSEGVKYVPYSYVVATNNMYDWNKVTFSLERGSLPEGVQLYPETGEIYGVPKVTGEFPITIRADFSRKEFDSAYASFVLNVKENSNLNVYGASDEGYELKEHVGEEQTENARDYLLTRSGDQLFVSAGEFGEFIDLWLNGEKLTEGVDYTKESGSTRITIREQTFENKASQEGSNTLAAEFRVDGDTKNELKRTAQNFQIDIRQGGGSKKHHSSDGNDNQSSGGQGNINATNYASLVVRLVNASGIPLPNMTVELHSTPKVVKTNQNGIAIFTEVESGAHTIYVKDENGTVLASKAFELVFGERGAINGSQIVVKSGSASTLTVQLEGSDLRFINVQDGDVYQVLPAGTGDDSSPMLWFILVILTCAVCGGVFFYEKRRRTYKG